jgi:hypothetical protein
MVLAGVIEQKSLRDGRYSAFSDCVLKSQKALYGTEYLNYYFTNSASVLTLQASPSDPFIWSVAGDAYKRESTYDLSLGDNLNHFIWIDTTGALGRSDFPCYHTIKAPTAPAVDQHWFDLLKRRMYRWDGAAWVNVDRIFIGFAKRKAGSILSIPTCSAALLTPYKRFKLFGDCRDGFKIVTGGTDSITDTGIFAAVIWDSCTVQHPLELITAAPLIHAQNVIALFGVSVDLKGRGRQAPAAGTNTTGSNGNGGCNACRSGAGGGGSAGAGGLGGNRLVAASLGGSTGAPVGGALGPNNGDSSEDYDLGDNRLTDSPELEVQFGPSGGNGGGTGVAVGGRGGHGGGAMGFFGGEVLRDATTTFDLRGDDGETPVGAGKGGGGGASPGIGAMQGAQLFDLNPAGDNVLGGTGGAPGDGTAGYGGNSGQGHIFKEKIPV